LLLQYPFLLLAVTAVAVMAMGIILLVQLIQATKFGWSHITEMTEHMFLAIGEIVSNGAFMGSIFMIHKIFSLRKFPFSIVTPFNPFFKYGGCFANN
jgi:hypothetical protein